MNTEGKSVYKKCFEDPMGIFFTKEEFPQLNNALINGDVSDVLQEAIFRLVREQKYGIVYIPEGRYPLAKTVYIPKAVRLIGYGKTRPVFVLPENAKGFENHVINDCAPGWGQELEGANYMIWFVSNTEEFNPNVHSEIKDANAGTFYSALSNIDFKIEGNHPGAVCIRAHFAQHAFISHSNFELGSGYAAMYDVGNEMEDLNIFDGEYGLLCRTTSPGWPFALFDTKFDGQRKAAIMTTQNGFTGFRLHILNSLNGIGCWNKDTWEKLYLEDCLFENITDTVVTCSESGNVGQQTNFRNVNCKNVGRFIHRLDIDEDLYLGKSFSIDSYTSGYCFSDLIEEPVFEELYELKEVDEHLSSDIPLLPEMSDWVSVANFGATGDGVTDDTIAIQKAVDSGKSIYFPQGMYRVSDSIIINRNVNIIGMHPASTQIIILDDEEAFAGFGTPKPLLSVEKGVKVIMNGIGVDTASKNPRAAGILWEASEDSYMNDVKLMGGHGMMFRDGRNPFETLYNPSRTADFYPERQWDYQYASLWIANSGGGIFKDIWSCSPYAEAGIAITDTKTKCRMYAISLEHHVRHEIKINNVSNLKIYALQTEEEKAEGTKCLPMEIVSSSDIDIINYYLFRVVSVNEPYDTGIRVWNVKNVRFLNIRNMAQMQYTFTVNLKDQNSGFIAKSSDYAKLEVTGKRKASMRKKIGDYIVLSEGYSFAQGVAVRNNGNVYWCDKKAKTIYCYDKEADTVYPVLDIHYIPSALAFDTKDHLIVTVDFSELKKHAQSNPFEDHDRSDPHPYFSWFYKRGEKAYSVDPDHPYISIKALKKVSASEVKDKLLNPVIRCAELDYPGSYQQMVEKELEYYYLAADGVTLIEGTKDIARALRLNTNIPNEKGIITDDFLRKSYEYEVLDGGNLRNGLQVTKRGQYGAVKDKDGIIWTVEDRLYGYKNGELVKEEAVPWDAYSLILDGDIRYIIGRGAIYKKI